MEEAASAASPRILCVDDEPHVTAGIRRTFFDEFDIETAESGEEALQLIASDGPFAVVVSDMRMPHMDGATLLSRVRRQVPDTVRILLTGQTELDAAVAAVNEGNIFRFLSKPCPEETLRRALQDGIRQYELIHAERQLLEQTLHGAVQVLVQVLEMAAPSAFAHSSQVKACVRHMAQALGLNDVWQLDLAAMLSYLGFVAIPPDTIAKYNSGRELEAEESRLIDGQREVAFGMLQRIPRLAGVAAIVRGQPSDDPSLGPTIGRDTALLDLAMTLDRYVGLGKPPDEALQRIRMSGKYPNEWLAALRSFASTLSGPEWRVKQLTIHELEPGMRVEEDVVSPSGGILVPKGRDITAPLIERLKNFALRRAVVQPVTVAVKS